MPLSAFTTMKETTAPLVVNHEGQFPSATISFDLAPGYALGDAVTAIEAAQKQMGMPASIQASFQGTAQAFRASLTNEPLLILAAVITVYIVLGVLYESYVHPLTILSTLPSAGVGAILALQICRTDLSVIALIGIILLIGIVKKNAIMMIDFALEAQREEGKPPREAIYEACLLAFPSDHDDHDGGAAGRSAVGVEHWHRLGTAPSAGNLDRRRVAGQPVADLIHHAGGLPVLRPAVIGLGQVSQPRHYCATACGRSA